jgi:hypothetical protein
MTTHFIQQSFDFTFSKHESELLILLNITNKAREQRFF